MHDMVIMYVHLNLNEKDEEKSLVVITYVVTVSTAALCDHVVCQFPPKLD